MGCFGGNDHFKACGFAGADQRRHLLPLIDLAHGQDSLARPWGPGEGRPGRAGALAMSDAPRPRGAPGLDFGHEP